MILTTSECGLIEKIINDVCTPFTHLLFHYQGQMLIQSLNGVIVSALRCMCCVYPESSKEESNDFESVNESGL